MGMARIVRWAVVIVGAAAFLHLGYAQDGLATLGIWPADGIAVGPHLQAVGRNGITVMWRTDRPSRSEVCYGRTSSLDQVVRLDGHRRDHEVRIRGLAPATQYFYQVVTTDRSGRVTRSPRRTFRTAPGPDDPFTFVVMGDTQSYPAVTRSLATSAWEKRPGFLLLVGDLVRDGRSDRQWRREFFPSMDVLLSRVAMYPAIGNHEKDAHHYYRYMSLPAPEYRYAFDHGNARFLVVDSNRPLGPGSAQWVWLDRELSRCDATWKIIAHHHPAYTSDADDYGDLEETGESTFGDPNARSLSALCDRHGVDLVFSGHIHAYERTWPLRGGQVVETGGTVHVITGGGGGGLEEFGPIRPVFSNVMRAGSHHYLTVHVNGGTLEGRAYDLEGRLFDVFRLTKPETPPRR